MQPIEGPYYAHVMPSGAKGGLHCQLSHTNLMIPCPCFRSPGTGCQAAGSSHGIGRLASFGVAATVVPDQQARGKQRARHQPLKSRDLHR